MKAIKNKKTQQLNKLDILTADIEAIIEKRAQQLFEEMKIKESNKKPHRIAPDKLLTGKRLDIFNILNTFEVLDRHEILDKMNEDKSIGLVGQSSVSGRLFELVDSGLVKVVGSDIGMYGKPVSLYATTKGDK